MPVIRRKHFDTKQDRRQKRQGLDREEKAAQRIARKQAKRERKKAKEAKQESK